MRFLRRAAILAGVGLTCGPVLDYAHVRVGAIGYTEAVPFVPWWVPLVYLGAALGIGLSHPALDQALARPARPLTPLRLALGFAALVTVWVGSGAFPLQGLAMDAALATIALLAFAALDGTWQGALLALTTAVTGFGVEVALSRAGLFYHTRPDILGIASWLPWLYVAGSVATGNLGRWLALPEGESAGETPPRP